MSKNFNYYDNLRWGVGEVKLYYYAMKGSRGGGGGSFQKHFYKKS